MTVRYEWEPEVAELRHVEHETDMYFPMKGVPHF